MSSSAGSSGAVVNRRLNKGPKDGTPGTPSTPVAPGSGNTFKPKPSIRQTIESMVSTGSQSEFFKTENTIIIFDWDDTLCPSSWIRQNRRTLSFFRPAPPQEKYQRPLRELSRYVESVLKLAVKLGNVVIVTNAVEPWVETSCRNFLPSILPIVSGLPVIYARSIFETVCCDPPKNGAAKSSAASRASSPGGRAPLPGLYSASGHNRLSNYNSRMAQQQFDEMAPQRWKEVAFEQEISGFYSRYAHQSWKNVLSIGDSIFERDAVRKVVLLRPTAKKKCRTKTLKLLDDPEIDELTAQVRVVHDVLNMMVQYDGDLDIEIDEEDLRLDIPLADKILD